MEHKIKGCYKYSENYTMDYVHGTLATAKQNGEVSLQFFFEAPPELGTYELQIDETGKILYESQISNIDEFQSIREIKSGIVLSLDAAQSLIDSLQSMVDILKQNQDNVE